MKESDLLSKDLSIIFQLNNQTSFEAEIRLKYLDDASETLRKKAEIKFLN